MRSLLAAAALSACLASGAHADYVIDTGTAPSTTTGYSLWNDGPEGYQSLGVSFELAADTRVASIASWLVIVDAVGALQVDLFAGGTPEGPAVYSGLFAPPGSGPAWFGASGLDLALEAGTYTVTFTSTGSLVAYAPFPVAAPLGVEWVDNAFVAGGWRPIESLDIGLRVAAVPEPASYALMAFGLLATGAAARRRRAS